MSAFDRTAAVITNFSMAGHAQAAVIHGHSVKNEARPEAAVALLGSRRSIADIASSNACHCMREQIAVFMKGAR